MWNNVVPKDEKLESVSVRNKKKPSVNDITILEGKADHHADVVCGQTLISTYRDVINCK
jgi:hypothetical protein